MSLTPSLCFFSPLSSGRLVLQAHAAGHFSSSHSFQRVLDKIHSVFLGDCVSICLCIRKREYEGVFLCLSKEYLKKKKKLKSCKTVSQKHSVQACFLINKYIKRKAQSLTKRLHFKWIYFNQITNRPKWVIKLMYACITAWYSFIQQHDYSYKICYYR